MNTRFLMTLCCCLLPFTLKGAGKEDMKWFTDAKFGMFIHWGLYSQTAGDWKGHPTKGGEHFMLYERIPVKEYALIANDFNPTEFNARKWVKTAKEAGMKYIVITSKHHDGFAMYHSACSDYNIVTRTPFARDPEETGKTLMSPPTGRPKPAEAIRGIFPMRTIKTFRHTSTARCCRN